MMDPSFILAFRSTIDDAAERLLAIADEGAAYRPAPGKWSRKEIIGHLIDSAANNHGRFVRAQLQDDLVFPGYDQDGWVRAQRYQERRWPDLVRLWQAYNRHIADVMASASPDAVDRPRARHNLDELAWGRPPAEGPVTLAWFMQDYVAHLEHHLRQV